MPLDPATLQITIIVTGLTAVAALAIVATGRRVPGLWSLSGAVLCMALTFTCYFLSEHLPEVLAVTGSNGAIALSLSLLLLPEARAARAVATDGLSVLQGLGVLWALLRNGGIGIGRGRHILLASVLVLVLLFAARCVAIGFGMVAAAPPMPSVAPFDTFSYLIAYLIVIFAMLGFVLATAEINADEHRQMALQDPLTSLPNRRAVLDALEKHWSAAIGAQRPLTVLLIDVDHFKQVNDKHGHAAGDAVLRRLAKLLRLRVRRQGRTLPITASMGLQGIWPTASDTIAELIHKADGALYRAKAAGRNCVIGD